mmetsp:Transcript_1688/g.5048  ORF Transcript_1688/g.5048 Transcript_1688/m.5048 type:complete len:281 (+) Transcript_1688:317-1159(+)
MRLDLRGRRRQQLLHEPEVELGGAKRLEERRHLRVPARRLEDLADVRRVAAAAGRGVPVVCFELLELFSRDGDDVLRPVARLREVAVGGVRLALAVHVVHARPEPRRDRADRREDPRLGVRVPEVPGARGLAQIVRTFIERELVAFFRSLEDAPVERKLCFLADEAAHRLAGGADEVAGVVDLAGKAVQFLLRRRHRARHPEARDLREVVGEGVRAAFAGARDDDEACVRPRRHLLRADRRGDQDEAPETTHDSTSAASLVARVYASGLTLANFVLCATP